MAHAWKACWVQALGGSNPPSSATGPRDRFRFRGFLLPVEPLVFQAPLVFRAPARSPHASLRLGVVDLEARPCPPDPPAPSAPAALVVLGLARPGPPAPTGTAAGPRRPPALRQLPPAPSTPAAPARRVVRRVVSKPGQASPPPTSTAARPCLDAAHRRRGKLEVCSPVVMRYASSQLRARGENVYAGGRSSA